MYDSSDALGAGSYPSPADDEQRVCGQIVVTYKIDTYAPKNWDIEEIYEDIKRNIDEYVDDFRYYEDIDIDV